MQEYWQLTAAFLTAHFAEQDWRLFERLADEWAIDDPNMAAAHASAAAEHARARLHVLEAQQRFDRELAEFVATV